jgi:hypothetical protein
MQVQGLQWGIRDDREEKSKTTRQQKVLVIVKVDAEILARKIHSISV